MLRARLAMLNRVAWVASVLARDQHRGFTPAAFLLEADDSTTIFSRRLSRTAAARSRGVVSAAISASAARTWATVWSRASIASAVARTACSIIDFRSVEVIAPISAVAGRPSSIGLGGLFPGYALRGERGFVGGFFQQPAEGQRRAAGHRRPPARQGIPQCGAGEQQWDPSQQASAQHF
jgi:hypothetical protein